MGRRRKEDSLTAERTKELVGSAIGKGIKVKLIAEKCGVTSATVYNWAKGTTCAPKQLEGILEAF